MAEKGIRTVWIDSDSVGVLGTKVYRDDILIATVPFGTQFYNDPTAVIGVNYKYEVQAYNSTSESTDEVLGTNASYYTIQDESTQRPLLTNFRVEEANKDRVYFDSSTSITGTDFTGFVITTKTITELTITNLTINLASLTGHYFTVNSSYNFYNRATTIRYVGGSDIANSSGGVFPFTLQHVVNNLDEPDASNIIYAAATVQGNGSGDSEANAMTYQTAGSTAQAGDEVRMKSGSSSSSIVVANSGDLNNPIKFIGYKDTFGDAALLDRTIGMSFDSADMPLITGAKFDSNAKNYLIVKNLQVYPNSTSIEGFDLEDSDYLYIYNTYTSDCKHGFFGSRNSPNNYVSIVRTYVADGDSTGITIPNFGHLIEDAFVCSSKVVGMDYYINIYGGTSGGKCVIKDCVVDRYESDNHGNPKGIDLKADEYGDDFILNLSLIENCTVNNVKSAVTFQHSTSYDNVARGITATRSGSSTMSNLVTFRDEAHDNIIENSFADGVHVGVQFDMNAGEDLGVQAGGINNKVINCIFSNCDDAIYNNSGTGGTILPSTGNEWINCTFINCTEFMNWSAVVLDSTNKVINSIFDTVPTKDSGQCDFTFTNNLFWNGFTGLGAGAITTIDPDLDANFEPQADFTQIRKSRIDGVYYGKNGNERQDDTTVGSVLSAEEAVNDTPFAIISYNISQETDTTARVQCYMTEQCSINYYVNGVKNPVSSDGFDAGEIGPNEFVHTRTLIELPPGQTSTLVIELTAQDNGEIIQSENIPLTTTGTPITYDFYVSADGTGDGLSDATPMSFADSQTTINSMTSGQSIAYKGGDEFFGQLTLTGKSGITITSYDGKAIITGSEPITGWSDQGGNVWTKDVTGKVINNVFKNGLPANNTRMPLPDMYTIGEGSSNTSIICPEIAGISYPDIVGATVYAEQNQWTVNNRPVTAFDPITGTITVSGTEAMTIGTGFTIHNSKNLLATQDDWAYDQGTNTLYVYSVGEPTGITATTIIDKGIYLDGCDNITIDNIDVNGFGTVGIALSNTNTTTISNSKVHDCTNRCISENSIYDAGNYDIIVSDCDLYNTNDHAIRIYGKVTMEDNIIHDVSMLENRTWTGTSAMTGISASGDDSVIQRNTMYNFGYNAISFGGQRMVIQNNFIEDHNVYYHDGSGIYTYSTDWNDTSGDNAQILSNTIINYQPRFRGAVTCIYLDDRSKLITVDGNTTQGAMRGIFLHNTRDTTITNNTIHNATEYGIGLSEDSNGGDGNMYGNIITGNIVLIEESNFGTAPIGCSSQYASSDFGTFNSNVYYSMGNYSKVNVKNTIDYTYNSNFPQENTLEQWQAKNGDDALTETNTSYYDTFTVDTQGPDQVSNGDFSNGTTDWGAENGTLSDGGGYLIATPSNEGCKVYSNNSRYDVVEGDIFMIEYDVKGNAEQRMVLRTTMTGTPYSGVTNSILVDTSWKSYRFYIEYGFTGTNVRLDFFTESLNQIHLDNIKVSKITLGEAPQNSFLAYNETSVAKDVTLPTGTWDSIDGTVTNQTGTVNVSAYSSLIMIKQ